MDRTPAFQQIAQSIRQEILFGTLKPDEELPTVREMAGRWGCSPGTVMRAYRELASQGLVVSRAGSGTRVASGAGAVGETPLRRAALINQAETFLLAAVSAGYSVDEITLAVHMALDRWRVLAETEEAQPVDALRFAGSHDPALPLLSRLCAEHAPGVALHLTFVGSLGGLIALARSEADIAGVHLWDSDTDTYNQSFVRRLLPGRRTALLTLADRHVGLIVAPANPLGVRGLADLARADVRFINRQSGSGTRVWLDAQLSRQNLAAGEIAGYANEAQTHSEVANIIAEGRADVGLGIEAAALAYGLDFIRLTTERYDLVIPQAVWAQPPVVALAAVLASDATKALIERLGGYDTSATGSVVWVD